MPEFHSWIKKQKTINAGDPISVDAFGRPVEASIEEVTTETLPYSNPFIEDASGSATNVSEALDFILQVLRDNSLIASTVLLWDGTTETDLITPQGQTFANATFSATGGPSDEAKVTANTHATLLTLSGIPAGSQYRCTIMRRSSSGGGTFWHFNVQSGATSVDTQSGTWTQSTVTVTIGANGVFSISASWNPEFAYLLVENLGVA